MGFVACLFLCVGLVAGASVPYRGVSEGGGEPCQPDKLTVYKVVLHTFWSRDRFPKHYPDWRPPAQWTKVFGKFKFHALPMLHYFHSFSYQLVTWFINLCILSYKLPISTLQVIWSIKFNFKVTTIYFKYKLQIKA